MGIKTVAHPPYSPDLAPCDFWLFPKLRGCRYETIEEMKEAVTKVIDMLTQEDFDGGLPEVVGTVQQVHCSRRRLLRKGLEFHVCTINKSAHTKKGWKFIVCTSYVWFVILELNLKYQNVIIYNHSTKFVFMFYFSFILSDLQSVTLCRWPAKQTISLSVLARNQTKGFRTWNLAVSGSGNGMRKESWLGKGADKSWRRDTDRGGRQWTPEQRGEAAWDRVQRRRSSQDVGIPVALWNFR